MLCLMDSIRQDEPAVPRLLQAIDEAHTLTEILLAVWALARLLAIHLVEAVLAERALSPPFGPRCPTCGAFLRSKGCVQRPVLSLCGPICWRRRVGRCPQGCETPPGAPLDDELGGRPDQRSSAEFPYLGWALAVLVPCATAALLRRWYWAGSVSAQAVWAWVQTAGRRAMEQLHAQLQAVAQGHLPLEEPLPPALAAAPLLMGADGVMVPLRPEGGQPRGKTAWHEVTVGVWARLGRHRTRTGKLVARLQQRRRVAVFGDIEALQQRLWLEAVRQGVRPASQVVWLRDGARGLGRLFEEGFTA